MSRTARTLAVTLAPRLAAAALLLAPAAAHALPGAVGTCGGNSYALCFNLTDFAFGAPGNGLGADQLRFTLENATAAAYAPATLGTFLISGLGGAYRVSSLAVSTGSRHTGVSSVTQPSADNGFSSVGYVGTPQPHFIGWDNNGGSAGLTAGEQAIFTFTFTRNIVQTDFMVGDVFAPGVQFVAHAHGASAAVGTLCGGTSSKAAFDASGGALAAGPADPACALEGPNARLGVGGVAAVVPEPGTFVMLGTGVVGLIAVARRRRS